MKAINHLVLAARDLARIRETYESLGFTLTPSGQHPFGTGNTIIQLNGAYLELLAVTRPQDVVEHSKQSFSFSAFNRDYLARHEGFSMVVFDSQDARADLTKWKSQGLTTFDPFDFSRQAKMPDGRNVTVGFALAQTMLESAPWLGHFACQHFRRDYYEQPQYLTHANTSRRIKDVWISGPDALATVRHLAAVIMAEPEELGADWVRFDCRSSKLIIASSEAFAATFGMKPPHPEDGPHLCGLTISCDTLEHLPSALVTRRANRAIVDPAQSFGTALAFATD